MEIESHFFKVVCDKLSFALVFFCKGPLLMVCAESEKTWMPSTNYWDASNWDVKRIPCRNDLVIFPADSSSAVALHPGATSLREMVLPLTGEVLLAQFGELTFSGKQVVANANCPGECKNVHETIFGVLRKALFSC